MGIKGMIVVLVGLLVVSVAARAETWTLAGMGNDETIKLFLGVGDPNEGIVGPVVGWREGQDHLLWQAGLRAELDISANAQAALDKLLNPPDAWWELLTALDAHTYLLAEVGAVDVAHGGQAWAAPGIKLRVGPISYQVSYDIFEGGQARDMISSGVTHFLGIEKRL